MPTRAARRPIDVQVFPAFRAKVKAPWVRRVAAEALAVGDPDGTAGVSIAVADDDTLRSLNSRFRGFDEVTDVLAFGLDGAPGPGSASPFPDLSETESTIGEVVLSYPLAVHQAGEHSVPAEEELALLVIHGILHLLGHDHEERDDESRMKRFEQQALARMFRRGAASGATR